MEINILIVLHADAHAELTCPRFHALSNHKPITRLKNMKGAGDSGIGESANKDWHFMLSV